jgi:hypothetical protein
VLLRQELLQGALRVERCHQPRRERLQVVDPGDGGEVDRALAAELRPCLVGGRARVDEQVRQLTAATGEATEQERSAILDGLATLQRLLTPDTVERGAC